MTSFDLSRQKPKAKDKPTIDRIGHQNKHYQEKT
jgi:hypothetical protein